jgi:hypothetical protein
LKNVGIHSGDECRDISMCEKEQEFVTTHFICLQRAAPFMRHAFLIQGNHQVAALKFIAENYCGAQTDKLLWFDRAGRSGTAFADLWAKRLHCPGI